MGFLQLSRDLPSDFVPLLPQSITKKKAMSQRSNYYKHRYVMKCISDEVGCVFQESACCYRFGLSIYLG